MRTGLCFESRLSFAFNLLFLGRWSELALIVKAKTAELMGAIGGSQMGPVWRESGASIVGARSLRQAVMSALRKKSAT